MELTDKQKTILRNMKVHQDAFESMGVEEAWCTLGDMDMHSDMVADLLDLVDRGIVRRAWMGEELVYRLAVQS